MITAGFLWLHVLTYVSMYSACFIYDALLSCVGSIVKVRETFFVLYNVLPGSASIMVTVYLKGLDFWRIILWKYGNTEVIFVEVILGDLH